MPGNSLDWNPPKGKGGTAPFCNPLLVRPELAKVKATTYDLPDAGYTYGKAMTRDAEDASAGGCCKHLYPVSKLCILTSRICYVRACIVTMSWKEHQPNPDQVSPRHWIYTRRTMSNARDTSHCLRTGARKRFPRPEQAGGDRRKLHGEGSGAPCHNAGRLQPHSS